MNALRAPIAVLAGALAPVATVAASPLPPPFAVPAARTITAPANCPSPPTPNAALDIKQAYAAGDRSYSRIDPVKQAARQRALRDIRTFTSGVALMANRYVSSNGARAEQGGCALRWLKAWADAGAMSRLADHDAQFVLSVQLSGWTLAYMQVRNVHFSSGDPHRAILRWFATLSDRLQAHTDGLTNVTGRNNHRYWAGLAAMGVGANTGEAPRIRWALASARVGLDQITPLGALPLELDRKKMAGHYHLYAAAPLVMMAEIARGAHADLYGYDNGALHRLVAFATRSLRDPTLLSQLSGTVQMKSASPTRYADKQAIAWIEFYACRFPGRSPDVTRLLAFRQFRNPELGGDLSMLVRPRR